MQQVAKNFREIFGELAPGGRGELVMQKQLRPDPQEDAHPEEDEEAGPSDKGGAMERYAGVKVKVGPPPCFLTYLSACHYISPSFRIFVNSLLSLCMLLSEMYFV